VPTATRAREMKHTKGEWEWFDNGQYLEVRGSESLSPNIAIFTISRQDHHDFDEDDICEKLEAIANAKLIAAAPDLLEACIKMIEHYDRYLLSQNDVYTEMKAAINKATI